MHRRPNGVPNAAAALGAPNAAGLSPRAARLASDTSGTINQRSSVGTSNYNALWLTATKRVSHGLQFAGNYTWSKSLDLNSRNGLGVADSTRPETPRWTFALEC